MSDIERLQQWRVIRAIRDKAKAHSDVHLLLYFDDLARWYHRDGNPDTMPVYDTRGHWQHWQRMKQMHVHIG